MQKEIPILFSTEMVRAILADRKIMTRRTRGLEKINESPEEWDFLQIEVNAKGRLCAVFYKKSNPVEKYMIPFPYGQPGDFLWVRESFRTGYLMEDECFLYDEQGNHISHTWYKADAHDFSWFDGNEMKDKIPWKPSIHMPKTATRIWLEVTGVRVERLQDIREDDARREGIEPCKPPYDNVKKYGWRFKDYIGNSVCFPKASFETLWKKINGQESWTANPWVWVVSFKVLSKTGKP